MVRTQVHREPRRWLPHGTLVIEPLAAHPEVLPVLRQWFEMEWPSYYGAGGPGDAERDLDAFAQRGSLPVGVVAFLDGSVCGVAALKSESIPSHRHLSPWASAGLVQPLHRSKGIGLQLLSALEQEARNLGFNCIYCATGTAESLLQRCGWQLIEHIDHDGQNLGLYRKALQPNFSERR